MKTFMICLLIIGVIWELKHLIFGSSLVCYLRKNMDLVECFNKKRKGVENLDDSNITFNKSMTVVLLSIWSIFHMFFDIFLAIALIFYSFGVLSCINFIYNVIIFGLNFVFLASNSGKDINPNSFSHVYLSRFTSLIAFVLYALILKNMF